MTIYVDKESYFVVELSPGSFFSGKLGNPIVWEKTSLPKREYSVWAGVEQSSFWAQLLKVFPQARLVRVQVSYELL